MEKQGAFDLITSMSGWAGQFVFLCPWMFVASGGSMQDPRQCIATLEAERNTQHRTISWRFTSQDARVKLSDLSPAVTYHL